MDANQPEGGGVMGAWEVVFIALTAALVAAVLTVYIVTHYSNKDHHELQREHNIDRGRGFCPDCPLEDQCSDEERFREERHAECEGNDHAEFVAAEVVRDEQDGEHLGEGCCCVCGHSRNCRPVVVSD